MKKLFLFAFLNVVLFFSSCKDDKTNDPVKYGAFKIVHASFDAPNLDVYVDGLKTINNAAFKSASDFSQLSVGTHSFKLTASGSSAALETANRNIEEGKNYSIFVTGSTAEGSANALNYLTVIDDPAAPAAGNAKIRIAHVADAPAVDLVILDGDSVVTSVLVENLPLNTVTGYAELAAGTYLIGVRAAGNGNPILAAQNVTLADGKIYAIAAMGRLTEAPALEFVSIVEK